MWWSSYQIMITMIISKKNVKTITIIASQMLIFFFGNFFGNYPTLRHLATMHDRVTKDRRVLTLQVNDHCIINIFLKDILLKTKLLNHAFFKKPSLMGVFNSAIVQLHDTYTAKSLFMKLDEGRKKKRRHND